MASENVVYQPQTAETHYKVLVMDDEQGILDMLSYQLSSCGYIVEKAYNGEEGVEKIRKEKFHLVISDVKMPKLNGMEALGLIKEIDPTAEVIMTTGFGTIDMAVECIKKGAYDFISKPYNMDELCSKVEKALERQRLTSELISLKELNRLKSEFLANTSHELRTPMNAILGYTSLLLDRVYGELNAKQEQALKRINSNANNLLQLINNILDVSKLSSGKITLLREAFNLNTLMQEVTDMMDALAKEKDLTMQFDFSQELSITTDRARLKQVLVNLIGNAIKFTLEGGITVSARLCDASGKSAPAGDGSPADGKEQEFVRIDIKDTGIGIKPEHIKTIFEEFRQGDASTTREFGGTGLGLSITKKLLELMNGTIQVESAPDAGSTFSVVLPRK